MVVKNAEVVTAQAPTGAPVSQISDGQREFE
jgi:hypothetical protein